jgi:hypothetical protein
MTLDITATSKLLPSGISGLSLWLKADSGVTTSYNTYVSQIVLTCTGGLSSYSGTYIATSTPDVYGTYLLFCSANSKYIAYENFFKIETDFMIASSGNGINWTLENVLVAAITINGSNDENANGAYGLNERNQSTANLINNAGYNLNTNTSGGCEIYTPDNLTLLYSNSSNGSGAWTNEGGTGTVTGSSITLDPSGTASGSVTTSYYSPFVTAWADQSGNGNNASVENSGEEPTFVSSFSNSKPAIQFNGTSQLLIIPDSNSLDFLNTSIFIVLKRTGNGTGNEITFMKNGNNLQGAGAYWQTAKLNGANSNFAVANGGSYDRDSGVDIGDGIARVMDFTFDGTDFNIYVNGSQTATYNDQVGNINTTSGPLQIGGYNQSFNNPDGELFNGQIAEIIMYNRAVTSTERQKVETYLNSKYAIY